MNFKQSNIILPPAELEHAASELGIFRENIQTALRFLKEHQNISPFSFRPKVPLFLVIGADSAGKSSLLAQSGLNLIDAARQAISNPISTRYCHFWFSAKEIFVDTAGYYTTASTTDISVNLAWRNLIKLLYRYRNRCSLSGLIITIDLPALSLDRTKRSQILNNIKQRIYEIAKYARNLPMFIVFTKSDLIAGFNEFFADLSVEECQQPFGINFQDTLGKMRPMQAFAAKFAILLRNLNSRMLFRLHQEIDMEKRGGVKDFPLQVESLKNTIAEVLNELPSNAQTAVHGIYFTSSLQRGTPIDYLPSQLERNAISTAAKNGHFYPEDFSVHQPYFVTEVFKNIIKTAKKNKKRMPIFTRRSLIAILSIVIVCFSLAGLFFYHAYIKSIEVVDNFAMALRDYAASSIVREQDSDDLERSYSLLQKFDNVNVGYRWQIFKHKEIERLHRQAMSNYRQALIVKFLPEVQAILETILNDAKAQNNLELYSALKTYLMLGDVARMEQNYVQNWFDRYWEKSLANDVKSLALQKIYLADTLQIGLTIYPKQSIISKAQDILISLPLGKIVYTNVKEESVLNKKKLIPENNSDLMEIFDLQRSNVTEFFTLACFSEINKKIAETASDIVAHAWVLNAADLNLEKMIQQAQELYFSEYVEVWHSVLNSVKISEFANSKQMAIGFRFLSSQNSPLLSLLKMLKANTTKTSDIQRFNDIILLEFKIWQGLDVNKLQKLLLGVADRFDEVAHGNNSLRSSWQIARNIMLKGKLPNEMESLLSFAALQPEPVKRWLEILVDNSWHTILKDARRHINHVWTNVVLPKYSLTLQNKYPLFKEAKAMISLADFTNFFGPKGTISNFFNDYLLPFVDTSKSYWVWKNVAKRDLEITQSTLEIFIRAELIKKMFYANSSERPRIKFTLSPIALGPDVHSFTLSLDGQVVNAAKGNMLNYDLIWPGPKPNEVSINFTNNFGKNAKSNVIGPWAWFKLLDRSSLQATGDSRRFDLLFDLNGNAVKYALLVGKAINPFISEIINKFRCFDKL